MATDTIETQEQPEHPEQEAGQPPEAAEPPAGAPTTAEQQPGAEPHGEAAADIDWKAKARLWESRAKDNKTKADDAASRAAEIKAELERTQLAVRISRETGVPIELVYGTTEEEMSASAKAAADWAAALVPGYPSDKGGSAPAAPVTRESIEQIKDPLERIRARAANVNLYA